MDFHLLCYDFLALWFQYQFPLGSWELCKMLAHIPIFFGHHHIRLSSRCFHSLPTNSEGEPPAWQECAPACDAADLVSPHDSKAKDCNLSCFSYCIGVRSMHCERSEPELTLRSGLGASTARMVITIHLVTVGRAVDDEDSFREYLNSCSGTARICHYCNAKN